MSLSIVSRLIWGQHRTFSRLYFSTCLIITVVVSLILSLSIVPQQFGIAASQECISMSILNIICWKVGICPRNIRTIISGSAPSSHHFPRHPPIRYISPPSPSISCHSRLCYPLLPLLDFNNKHSTVLTLLNIASSTLVLPRLCYVYRQYQDRELTAPDLL